jgi:hypothetical protein
VTFCCAGFGILNRFIYIDIVIHSKTTKINKRKPFRTPPPPSRDCQIPYKKNLKSANSIKHYRTEAICQKNLIARKKNCTGLDIYEIIAEKLGNLLG